MSIERAGWAFFLLVVSVPLAGCLEGSPSEPGSLREATASEHLAKANTIARKWDSGAALFAIVGLEGPNQVAFGGALPSWYQSMIKQATTDPSLGNGKSLAWAYFFESSGKPEESYVVVLLSNGEVSYAGGDAFPMQRAQALGDWRIGSDEAAAKGSREHNLGPAAGYQYSFSIGLGRKEDDAHAAWTMNAIWNRNNPDGSHESHAMIVIVDAVTGAVVRAEGARP